MRCFRFRSPRSLPFPSATAMLMVGLFIACSPTQAVDVPDTADASNGWEGVADWPTRYRLAGEWLDGGRSEFMVWKDGSNWRDGESHLVPVLPLAEGERVRDHLTCTQWQTVEIASFPQGESVVEWYRGNRPDRVEKQWKANIAASLWGTEATPAKRWLWLQRENYPLQCGMKMTLFSP